MIQITLIALKFAALITGGIFAAVGLLTDYRDKHGKVTRWGRIALFGIVLSTVIGAGTQAVESYRDQETALANDAANRKSEEQTRNMLGQIKRAIYPLRSIALEQLWISYPANKSLIAASPENLSFPSDNDDTKGHLLRGTSSYPRSGVLFQFIEPYVEVSFWKKGVDTSKNDPDLRFEMPLEQTDAVLEGEFLRVSAEHLPVPDDRLVLNQGIASLEDIRDAEIHLKIVIAYTLDVKRNPILEEIYESTTIMNFRLSIAGHEISAELEPEFQRLDPFLFVGKTSVK